MIDIMVIRGAGDISGGDVASPLLCTTEAAVSRGRQEIEAHAKVTSVSLKTIFKPGVRKGDIVQVDDPLQGPTWLGVIVGISHAVDGVETMTTLDIERPI